ncbi:MAG: DUF4150 domain-containing protein [Deltaproteobacteria bacterium]|nr:DUF4150 domain-containing protein [Deltaproteobacteria bacterium]
MGKVFANGREIVSKGNHGKVVAAFPDVCNSPPSPPAGPVPVPYAASSAAGSLAKGSKRVRIEGKPVGIRDKSYFASSPLGNEAATKSFGANVVTHQVTGKTYFGSWSMDVEVEGHGVLRQGDVTTSNHGSYPGGTPPFPNLSEVQQLALSRVEAGECPCCGNAECAAAFQPGEEPLSMQEFYGMVPGRPDFKPTRLKEHEALKSLKLKDCTCDGKVSPSPPCDVFRAPDTKRKKKIEEEWDRYREWYKKDHHKVHGVELRDSNALLETLLARYSAAEQKAMRATTKLSKTARSANSLAKNFDAMQVAAHQLARINHLTPKEAGGCPTNHNNLQPQQTLCDICQFIDQHITDHWQG